ncbi:hypothetical protein MRX96_051750 [Rhipicephalus microplus]
MSRSKDFTSGCSFLKCSCKVGVPTQMTRSKPNRVNVSRTKRAVESREEVLSLRGVVQIGVQETAGSPQVFVRNWVRERVPRMVLLQVLLR